MVALFGYFLGNFGVENVVTALNVAVDFTHDGLDENKPSVASEARRCDKGQ